MMHWHIVWGKTKSEPYFNKYKAEQTLKLHEETCNCDLSTTMTECTDLMCIVRGLE